MPIAFTIIKPRQTLEQQWAYLVERGQDNKLYAIKKFLLVLIVSTGLFLLLYFLTDVNDFITLKIMSMTIIPLGWCVLIILYLFIPLGKQRNQRRLKQFLDSFTEEQLSYSVQIDEEKVAIISTNYAYELPWTEFNCFGIHNETLYVFNVVKGLNSLYWNQSEMGSEAFSALLELLQQKSIKRKF